MKSFFSGCVTLFGLPFLLPGLFIMGMGFSFIFDFVRSASWIPVPAQLIEIKVDESDDSEGSTTYKVKGKFRYSWENREYLGDRITLDTSYSPGQTACEEMVKRFQHEQEQKHCVTVLVNPKRPEQSMATRELSVTMIVFPLFGLVFAIIGSGLTFGPWIAIYRDSRRRRIFEQFPERPWKADELWVDCRTGSGSGGKVVGAWVGAFFINGFAWTFCLPFAAMMEIPLWGKLIATAIGTPFLGFFVYAGYLHIQYRKYGSTQLVLSQVPLEPGTEARGLIQIPRRLIPEEGTRFGVQVKIFCERKEEVGSGEDSTTQTTVLFPQEYLIDTDLSRGTRSLTSLTVAIK